MREYCSLLLTSAITFIGAFIGAFAFLAASGFLAALGFLAGIGVDGVGFGHARRATKSSAPCDRQCVI